LKFSGVKVLQGVSFQNIFLFYMFVSSLSSCHEKATVALYFGRIHIRLGVAFPSFPIISLTFLPLN